MKRLSDYTCEALELLPAGRELDTLVWDLVHPELPSTPLETGAVIIMAGNALPFVAPKSSISIESSYIMLETYRRQGAFGCWTSSSPASAPGVTSFTVNLWRGEQRLMTTDEETLPLAMCRAIVLHAWDQLQQSAPRTEPRASLDALLETQRQIVGMDCRILDCELQRLDAQAMQLRRQREGLQLQLHALAKGGSDAR